MITEIKFNLDTIITLSTCHMTYKDNAILEVIGNPYVDHNYTANPFYVYPYDRGYFISIIPTILYRDIYSDGETTWTNNFSPEFVKLINSFRESNIDYVRFDCDGYVYSNLPKFEW